MEAAAAWMLRLVELAGPWGIAFAMLLDGACVPIPSEMILPLGGFLAAQGKVGLAGITLLANLGLVAGALLAYLAGRWGGRPLLLRLGRWFRFGPADLARAEAWFATRGHLAVFGCRFLPGLRTLVSIPAGIGGMPLGRFLWFTFLGSLPWTFALTYAGYALGHHWHRVVPLVGSLDRFLVPFLATLALLAVVWWRRAAGQRR